MNIDDVETHRSWRLNERHYGTLEGWSKSAAIDRFRFGDTLVDEWRRGTETRPPPLAPDDFRNPRLDRRYRDVPPGYLPVTESLQDVDERVAPYLRNEIAADLAAGLPVVVVGHGSGLRALVSLMLDMAPAEVRPLNVGPAQPWRFDLDGALSVVDHGYLDPTAARSAAASAANEAG